MTREQNDKATSGVENERIDRTELPIIIQKLVKCNYAAMIRMPSNPDSRLIYCRLRWFAIDHQRYHQLTMLIDWLHYAHFSWLEIHSLKCHIRAIKGPLLPNVGRLHLLPLYPQLSYHHSLVTTPTHPQQNGLEYAQLINLIIIVLNPAYR